MQGSAHRLSRRPLIAFEQMLVHILGYGDAGMTQHLRNHVSAAICTEPECSK
jgi:hypothetical protein